MLLRFSSLHRLLKVMVWCRRWLPTDESRMLQERASTTQAPDLTLTPEELAAAEKVWIRAVQAAKYEKEIRAVDKAEAVASRSDLSKLTPFMDEEVIHTQSGRKNPSRAAPVRREASHDSAWRIALHSADDGGVPQAVASRRRSAHPGNAPPAILGATGTAAGEAQHQQMCNVR